MESLKEIPKLSDQVMDAVRISAMAGERSAQRELTEQMLDKVVDIARLYSGQGISIEELIGTGNEALVTGVKLLGHLDSPREVDGELARRVMDSMEDLIAVTMENNTRDREMEDLVNLVADKAKELSQILGRKVTPQELAAVEGFSESVVRRIMPYVTFGKPPERKPVRWNRLASGKSSCLLRWGRVLEPQQGYRRVPDSIRALSPGSLYEGSADALLLK